MQHKENSTKEPIVLRRPHELISCTPTELWQSFFFFFPQTHVKYSNSVVYGMKLLVFLINMEYATAIDTCWCRLIGTKQQQKKTKHRRYYFRGFPISCASSTKMKDTSSISRTYQGEPSCILLKWRDKLAQITNSTKAIWFLVQTQLAGFSFLIKTSSPRRLYMKAHTYASSNTYRDGLQHLSTTPPPRSGKATIFPETKDHQHVWLLEVIIYPSLS